MFSVYYKTADTRTKYNLADRKARKEYRTICSQLNKFLDTTQIKQCGQAWKDIDPNRVTSITFTKQKVAFFNQNKKNNNNPDRVACCDNFKQYLIDKTKKNETIKGKRTSIYDFVKDAIKYGSVDTEESKLIRDTINSQWENNSKQNMKLNNMIALVDTSGSMEDSNCQPLYNAIGLGIRIAEKTTPAFRNRILTFSSDPEWVNLDKIDNFCDKVLEVRKANWGMNTDLYKACKLLLGAIVSNNIPPKDVEDLTLVILSDMQIDNSCKDFDSMTLYQNIRKLFQEAGLNSLLDKGLNSIKFSFEGTFFIILISSFACSSVIFSSKQIHSIKMGSLV